MVRVLRQRLVWKNLLHSLEQALVWVMKLWGQGHQVHEHSTFLLLGWRRL